MRSETIDYTIENRAGDLWITLTGPFTHDQVPTIREKFQTLIEDGNRSFVVDLEGVTTIDNGVVPLFLHLLNTLRSKSGMVKLVFKNEPVSKAFVHYRNIFSIFPDGELLRKKGILAFLQRQRRLMLRKTGIRVSRQIAIVLLIAIAGCFGALLLVIRIQNRYINEQRTTLHSLSMWETTSRIEIDKLRSRLQPFEQLGILKDSAKTP